MVRKRHKRSNMAIQGVLFSDKVMAEMAVLPPPVPSHAVSVKVIPPITDAGILRVAVQDCLSCDGCTDPDVLENFLGWLAMAGVDSS